MGSGLFRNGLVYLLIVVAIAALIFSVFSSPRQTADIDITQVATDIKKEVALPLAERKEIDKKYDVGNELYRILKEVKVTKAVL